MTAIVLGSGRRLTSDEDNSNEVGDVEISFKFKLFKSDEIESVEFVEQDEEDRDVEWRDEETDDELLVERVRKAVFERLKN